MIPTRIESNNLWRLWLVHSITQAKFDYEVA
jgi:hypothetical protein